MAMHVFYNILSRFLAKNDLYYNNLAAFTQLSVRSQCLCTFDAESDDVNSIVVFT